MTELEQTRLEDFKRILTFKTVGKIKRDFNGDYNSFYAAPLVWMKWRSHELDYNRAIYAYIIAFNQIAFSARQVQHIFGKDAAGKWLNYGKILDEDKSIKAYNKGTLCMRDAETKTLKRIQVWKRYQLPKERIAAIFNDAELLGEVLDAESDYYTDRQRRLIFSQVAKKGKSYHFKSKAEKEKERKAKARKMFDAMTDA